MKENPCSQQPEAKTVTVIHSCDYEGTQSGPSLDGLHQTKGVTKMAVKTKPKLIPVLVTTAKKGVFFGYVPEGTDLKATVIRIERAQMAVYWPPQQRGVLGLAAQGPVDGARIGPPVPAITLQEVTAVAESTDEAAKAWEQAPWR